MNRLEQSHLQVTALTHEGMKGKNNEDRYAVTAFDLNDKHHTPVLLAVLSDGIGGHRAGEVAAEIAVNRISEYIADSDGSQPIQSLVEAIHSASQEIFSTAQTDGDRQGMGGTCACVLIIGNRLYIANVGDSRIYLLRGGSIQQISTDHTWLQEALDSGLLTPDQIEGHPNKHIIRRYLGSPKPPQVETRLRLNGRESAEQSQANQGMVLKNGDKLLLCSDGLTDLVNNHEINRSFRQNNLETSSQFLINLANQRGGHDNITTIAIQIPESSKPGLFSLRSLAMIALVVLIVAALILAMFYGWLWVSQRALNNKTTDTPLPQKVLPIFFPSTTQTTIYPTKEITNRPTIRSTFSVQDFQHAMVTTTVADVFMTQDGPTLTPWPTNPLPQVSPPVPSPTIEKTINILPTKFPTLPLVP
jgi:serine/threonine protein phosphatase PrpC